ncbi:MAG: putative molybdenum carrier protein [Deltaproteobacteria bacterium]|nr:MAG: putative molybdenum carrier protein [Deltaproteobacteria bacterium]
MRRRSAITSGRTSRASASSASSCTGTSGSARSSLRRQPSNGEAAVDSPSVGKHPVACIVSGGQTGVDRAALDVALELGVRCAGFCPRGRWAEDGPIDARYPLRETASAEPAERTRRNAQDTDATLVLCRGAPAGGTAVAIEAAEAAGHPVLILDLGRAPEADAAGAWLRTRGVRTLNVAGPRESEAPGIYHEARAFLRSLLETAPDAEAGRA